VRLDLLVRHGRCLLPEGLRAADIGVADGRIVVIAEPGRLGDAAALVDATDQLVLAGVVDAHVHVRDPGQTHKEDYAHATRGAAAGGVTTIISQPNTVPPVTDVAGFEAVIEAARQSRVDHAICAGVTADAPDAMAVSALARAGAVGFEVLGDTAALDGSGWLRLFDSVAPTGLPLAYLAVDRAVMQRHLAEARGIPGASWRHFSRVVSGEAEALGYERGARLARLCGVPLIVRQVTTAAGLDVLREAKRASPGARLWVEVNAHHLFLTDEDLERLGPFAQMVPPPRPASELEALWRGVRDGTVDFISTDHAPHTREEKERGRADLWTAPTGVPGVEHLLPLLLDAALGGRLTLGRLTELVSAAPSRIHGLAPRKGGLITGGDADLVIVDPGAWWTIEAGRVSSRCGWSPFEGRRGRGRVTATFVRGRLVAQDGKPLDEPHGQLLRPGQR
jgi:dihydroorotase (multifunctional complex type)